MIPTLSLNPNSLATSSNERGATLLLLLMIALGSMLDPSPKARRFSRALFEICRHALADILANDTAAYKSSLNLQCAFLFSIGGAFSGRSTFMNLAVGQKNLCLSASAPGVTLYSFILQPNNNHHGTKFSDNMNRPCGKATFSALLLLSQALFLALPQMLKLCGELG